MKINLDTETKTIMVESEVSIEELLNTLKKFFPNEEWRDYKLVPKIHIVEKVKYEPIDISKPYINPFFPHEPYYGDNPFKITCNSSDCSNTYREELINRLKK